MKKEMEGLAYRKGYKYQNAEDYQIQTAVNPGFDIESEFITLTADGLLTIKSGYACDGPSGPCPDWLCFMRGAFVHDAFYQLMRERLLPRTWRDDADLEFRRVVLSAGATGWIAWIVWKAVDKRAASSADPKNRRRIYLAP